MKAVDVLVAARDRISNINDWTTGCLRWRLPDGSVKFCAVGSVQTGPQSLKTTLIAVKYLDAAAANLLSVGHQGWPVDAITINDGGTLVPKILRHARVLRMFDIAIKNAKRRHITGDRTKQPTAAKLVTK